MMTVLYCTQWKKGDHRQVVQAGGRAHVAARGTLWCLSESTRERHAASLPSCPALCQVNHTLAPAGVSTKGGLN